MDTPGVSGLPPLDKQEEAHLLEVGAPFIALWITQHVHLSEEGPSTDVKTSALAK